MSGQRPPDWGDSDDDVDAEAEQAAAQADARQVTAFLAALPDPVMPGAVQARVSAAIATAAADRAEAAKASGDTPIGRTLGRPPRRAKVRRPKVRQRSRFGLQAITTVAACLVIAGFGFLLTRLGGSSAASSSAISAPAATSAGAAEHSEAEPADSREIFNQANPPAEAPSASAPASTSFTVTAHGDVYQPSTLVSQVREQLAGSQSGATALAGSKSVPSSALVGCVLHLTGGTRPGLVDAATYAGRPVYVIAVPSRAWVVGRGCTATGPELITTVSLASLRGNLSALGSVEG